MTKKPKKIIENHPHREGNPHCVCLHCLETHRDKFTAYMRNQRRGIFEVLGLDKYRKAK